MLLEILGHSYVENVKLINEARKLAINLVTDNLLPLLQIVLRVDHKTFRPDIG